MENSLRAKPDATGKREHEPGQYRGVLLVLRHRNSNPAGCVELPFECVCQTDVSVLLYRHRRLRPSTQRISFRHSPENKACFNRLNSVLFLVTVVLPSSVCVESIVDGQTILLDPSIGNFDLL